MVATIREGKRVTKMLRDTGWSLVCTRGVSRNALYKCTILTYLLTYEKMTALTHSLVRVISTELKISQ